MGGTVFAGELATPRMPTEIYRHTLTHIEGLLRPYFAKVGHAIEAPAKTSHGDVDILVGAPAEKELELELDVNGKPDQKKDEKIGERLKEIIGAETWKHTPGSTTFHFAVKWPEAAVVKHEEMKEKPTTLTLRPKAIDLVQTANGSHSATLEKTSTISTTATGTGTAQSTEPRIASTPETTGTRTASEATPTGTPLSTDKSTASPTAISPASTSTTTTANTHSPKYIQIDIHICPDPTTFSWHLFFQAHGDLWNMIGGIIRPFGLTCTTTGLYLRIPELEQHNKTEARVLMTTKPTTVLEYLGLDPDRYHKDFASWDDMMDYIATCRFHNPARPIDMKSKDRQRRGRRPVYNYWINSYLPAHRDDQQPGKSASLTRAEVEKDAKAFFGPSFAAEFDDQRAKGVREIEMQRLWAEIKKVPLDDPKDKGWLVNGMKREIIEGPLTNVSVGTVQDQDQAEIQYQAAVQSVREAYAVGKFDTVLAWARDNSEQVVKRQKEFAQHDFKERLTTDPVFSERMNIEKAERKRRQKQEKLQEKVTHWVQQGQDAGLEIGGDAQK